MFIVAPNEALSSLVGCLALLPAMVPLAGLLVLFQVYSDFDPDEYDCFSLPFSVLLEGMNKL